MGQRERKSEYELRAPGGRPKKARPCKISSETDYGLAGDGFGEVGLARGAAVLEEAAGGEEFGVEQGGAGGSAD